MIADQEAAESAAAESGISEDESVEATAPAEKPALTERGYS